ncbi:MAG TPA: response regulator [Acidimicrobiales bacterium]|jgi:CheY-like chemotaxis protein
MAADGVRAVVCDGDRAARSTITAFVEDRGGSVLAEADRSFDAIDLIDRFEANLVVVDMALTFGSGIDVVRHVRERGAPCQIVVFTWYASTVRDLEGQGIRVVDKPDLDGLGRAIDGALSDLGFGPSAAERRRPTRTIGTPSLRAATGVDDPSEFYGALAAAEAGDALVGIYVDGTPAAVLAEDVRRVVRQQDRIILRRDVLVVLLVGGRAEGARAVLGRLAATWPGPAATAAVHVLDGTCDAMTAMAAVTG